MAVAKLTVWKEINMRHSDGDWRTHSLWFILFFKTQLHPHRRNEIRSFAWTVQIRWRLWCFGAMEADHKLDLVALLLCEQTVFVSSFLSTWGNNNKQEARHLARRKKKFRSMITGYWMGATRFHYKMNLLFYNYFVLMKIGRTKFSSARNFNSNTNNWHWIE